MNKTLFDQIGNTPLVISRKLNTNPNVQLYFKLEGNNPGGSVKDRAAYNMIKSALERGDIKPGDKLIEATSGNTGIALAMMASLFGLEIELVMPENSTVERVLTMQAFGATVSEGTTNKMELLESRRVPILFVMEDTTRQLIACSLLQSSAR